MAAVLDETPILTSEYMSARGAGAYAGVKKQAVFYAIEKGRLHPIHLPGVTYRVFFSGEVIAWRQRTEWRPTPRQLEILKRAGYKAEDFTPATPSELAASPRPSSPGGVPEATGAFITPADALAYIQVLSQSATTGAASVGGEVAERAMRPFAEAMRDGATIDVGALSRAAGDMAAQAMRPFADSFTESIAPLTESFAQAMKPHPTPPADDVVARQMGALRVELAQLLTRIMDAIRPMVERLAAGGYITPEDITPFMELVGELAGSLAGSPFYELAPRDAPALMPGILAQAIADGASPAPDTMSSPAQATPAPDAGKE